MPWSWAQGSKGSQVSLTERVPLKVAILPLAIHSPEDLGYMKEGLWDMLSSRVELDGRVAVLEKGTVKKAFDEVSGEMDTETARKLGQVLEADYVVFGSLTKLGDSSSLDLKLTEVKASKPSSPLFIQARKMEEIILQVDNLARKIDEKILGYPLRPPEAEKPAMAEKPAEAPKSVAAIPPSPAPIPPSAAVASAPPAFRPVIPGIKEKASGPKEFWQSTSFPFKAMGMAVGDLDGDGRNEIAFIDERNLWIYRYENEFKLLKKISGARTDKYLAVDVGDIDKDGKAEIFVTNLEGGGGFGEGKLSSFVVTFKDGDYRVTTKNISRYLRVVDWGERGAVLLGQDNGLAIAFQGPIYEMGWDGKGYKDIRKIGLSRVSSLYGFTPFFHEGKPLYAFIDSDSGLKVLDEKGKIIWKGGSYGSDIGFQVKPSGGSLNLPYDDADEMATINVRVIARKDEIFIIRNISPIGQFIKRVKYFSGGEIQRLAWNGIMFQEIWKSGEIGGYLVDFQTRDIDGAGGTELVVAVNLPKESILSLQHNTALLVSRIQ